MLFSLASIVAGLFWLATRDRHDILSWSVRPNWLLGFVIISLATLVGRLWVTIDAAQAAGADADRHPRTTLAGIALVLVLVAAPHVIIVDLAWQQRNVVTRLFTSEVTTTARPTPLGSGESGESGESGANGESTAAGERRITSVAVDLLAPAGPSIAADGAAGGSAGGDDGDQLASPAPTVPPTTASTNPTVFDAPATWNGDSRLSIVMLGSDEGYDRVGIRTDTIIVLSIDVATGDAITFSIPRNWENIPFPDGTPAAAAYPYGNPDLSNTIYARGLRRPELFPDSVNPGGAAVKEATAQLLGIPIHYFVIVDMTAVVETIDLFGGIDITVDEYINDRIKPITKGGPALNITTEPGDYHFDGLTTLAYVRSRVQSWDYTRMARQRCVVGALLDQVSPLDVLANYGPFTDIITDHAATDIPLNRADELIGIAARMDPARIQTVNFVPPEFPMEPLPLRKVRNSVSEALATDVVANPNQSLTAACGGERVELGSVNGETAE